MHLEKEIKVLNIEPDALHQQFLSYGGEITFAGNITDYFFDYTDGSLGKQKKRIRMRQQGQQWLLTCKERHFHDRLKVATEHEFLIDAPEEIRALLASYGLVCHHQEQKTRTEYKIGEVSFAVDTYAWAPPFLEIESPSTKVVYQWIKRLGLQKNTLLTCGREGLFRYYRDIMPQEVA
jgi:predicted adenylyl cyclase CyaB